MARPLSTKRTGISPAGALASGAGKPRPRPARVESTVTSTRWSLTATAPLKRVSPLKCEVTRCAAGAGQARRRPSPETVPASLMTMLLSFWVPPVSASGPPRKLAPTPLRLTAFSVNSILPSAACRGGKSSNSTISLLISCSAPCTLVSTACASGMRSFKPRRAPLLARASSVKWPIQSVTGLAAT